MYMPTLYAANNHCVIEAAKFSFNKYGHFLKIKKNESILELGTGDGRTTAEFLLPNLPRNIKELIISDKSKIMLDEARKNSSLSKMTAVELDFESKEIPIDFKNRFDHIFSFWAFHYVTDIRHAFQNIYNMLKPGGELFFIFYSETPTDESWNKLSNHSRWLKYNPNHWVSPYYRNPKILEIYQKYLNDCGFKNSWLNQDIYHYDFQSEKEFRGLMISVNRSVNKIPKEELKDYLEDYFELVKKSEGWSMKTLENGEELPSMSMKMFTLYGQKLQKINKCDFNLFV